MTHKTNGYTSETWTQERTADLLKLLEEKRKNNTLSMEMIAKRLGLSKNAVIGKVGRMKALGALPKFDYFREPLPRPRKPKPGAIVLEPLKAVGEPVNHGECPYVYGDPRKEFQYCGRKSDRPKAWCADHRKELKL